MDSLRSAVILLQLIMVPAGLALSPRPVRLMTMDNVEILGSYYPPTTNPAPAILLVHGLGQSRQVWTALATLLQQNGIGVLTIDLRGHGSSLRRFSGNTPRLMNYRSFRPRDFHEMLMDVNAAIDWLRQHRDVDNKRIGIIGSSVGASIALRYAQHDDELASLILFSPGLNDPRGLRTDDAMSQLASIRIS